MTAPAIPRCPHPRHFSYATSEYSISLDWNGLTTMMDLTFDVWDAVDSDLFTDKEVGDMFSALIEHIDRLRQWTGWGGIPAKYLGGTGGGAS